MGESVKDGSGTHSTLHALARHKEILSDYTADFTKTKVVFHSLTFLLKPIVRGVTIALVPALREYTDITQLMHMRWLFDVL
jgi:hypothetical protein